VAAGQAPRPNDTMMFSCTRIWNVLIELICWSPKTVKTAPTTFGKFQLNGEHFCHNTLLVHGMFYEFVSRDDKGLIALKRRDRR